MIDLFNQLQPSQENAIRAELSDEIGTWCNELSIDILMNLHRVLEYLKILRAESVVYPHPEDVLRIFRMLKLDDIKVVILGQDPYYTAGVANGIAFGCNVNVSPSLTAIMKAIRVDLQNFNKFSEGTHPNLEYLVNQGVFLLNTILTVEEGKPLSHVDVGWQNFTNNIISLISAKTDAIFLLWGNVAQSKRGLIKNNVILTHIHPAYAIRQNVSWDCKHFSEVNKILKERNQKEIQWI